MKYLNNEAIMQLGKEIVREHAPLILQQLGLADDNDGILDRINVTSRVGSDNLHGHCQAVIVSTRKLLSFSSHHQYKVGTAVIDLHPLMAVYYGKNAGVAKAPFFIRLMDKKLKEHLIFILAHELRHYWQYYTGEYFKNEIMLGTASIMPYEYRWCEQDANEFATQYIKQLKGGRQ